MNGSGASGRGRLLPNPHENRDGSTSSNNAALKGASLAFQKSTPRTSPTPTPTPTPASTSRGHDNGALIAATSASRDHSRILSRQTTGSSIQGATGSPESEQGMAGQSPAPHLPPPQRNHGASSHLGPLGKQVARDARSPSFIAATLAASRSASPVHQPTVQSYSHAHSPARRQRKTSVSANHSASSSVTSLDLETDMGSIPSTNTLISMFEKGRIDTDPVKKGPTEAPSSRTSNPPKPKPRAITPPRATTPTSRDEMAPSRMASSRAWATATLPQQLGADTARGEPIQRQAAVVAPRGRAPTPPPARIKHQATMPTQSDALEVRGKPRASTPPPRPSKRAETGALGRSVSQKVLSRDVRAIDSAPQGRTPSLNNPRSLYPVSADGPPVSSPPTDERSGSPASSDDSFVSASSLPESPPRGRSRPLTPESTLSNRPSLSVRGLAPTPAPARPPLPRRQQTSNLPLNSLTDAIVAGSLASARLTRSASPPPPPPPRKVQPTPPMRRTLRQPLAKSDDEEGSRARSKHRKSLAKLGNSKKHAHHEGARKRWREEITARERKRYEGVWASNRGLLLVPPQGAAGGDSALGPEPGQLGQAVANVVVRDLWGRSRLPADELAEVWDLVDRHGRGFLDKVEFVVGMWLIDQRLRGRKIPRKVSESVWNSASAGGVRVGEVKKTKGGK
ncbi:hypothetical protein GGS23DRAFT_543280 [Durotheca rogersii]|uniref:uncharacterized protein n=1 Tax=Durotheca rogersii TaxID=419775 RepID=UPI00221E93FC|nr:uncharacterized protein GGS23DRAFT_543280 [Durotheca rogersii]KAI5867941.1 hypothetical protein GGS23DRAFT_543280 [Durotheca rogersii]